mmetsp:Transcript_18326/g.39849  ORF Transcript_18326/g.39849 Transcript_18326/m.39849 type:complete len:90 (+) Transcript_18326:1848-2117(+)
MIDAMSKNDLFMVGWMGLIGFLIVDVMASHVALCSMSACCVDCGDFHIFRPCYARLSSVPKSGVESYPAIVFLPKSAVLPNRRRNRKAG